MSTRTIPRRRAIPVGVAALAAVLAGGCSARRSTSQEILMYAPHSVARIGDIVVSKTVTIGDTTLLAHIRGAGPTLLMIHGGGEDADMLSDQADAFASAGYRVITYDRRGTGGSGRDNWPGSGADQHADDAAALLDALGVERATVVGVSSGGVIAIDLAARHPERVDHVVAWEPPAVGLLPGGAAINDQIMAPIEEHLAEHPGDFVGAQALLLTTIVGFPVTVDDPAFAGARANAEPMIRDEPTITLEQFTADELAGVDLTVALGDEPLDVISAAADQIAEWTGRRTVHVAGDHEIYLTDPSVLTGVLDGV